jgi:carbon storage regulator
MLVLSRKMGETIVVGEGPDAIVIAVTLIDRGKVRLGITAPKSVPIIRGELIPIKQEGPNDGTA